MAKPSIIKAIFEKDDRAVAKDSSHKKIFFTREISGSVTQRLKRIHSKRFFRFTRAISDLIAHISTRIYGTAMLCFGLVCTLMYFLGLSCDTGIISPVLGILIAGLSIPFLLTDKPLPIVLQDFGPTDFLFFEYFCMKRHSATESIRSVPTFAAIIVGVIPAILSAFIPMWQIVLTIAIIICIYIGMTSPEFILLTSLLCLPYIRFIPYYELILCISVLIALISFIRKVLYGRRVFHLEQYDIILGVMLLFILISGIFVKGFESFGGSVRMVVLAVGYILAGNIITNRRLAELSANSIIISGAISSLISIGQVVVALATHGVETTQEHISFVLARQDGIAVYLMIATIFAVGMIGHTSHKLKGAFITASILCLIALVISGEFLAIASLVLAAGAYIIIKHNKVPALLLPLLLCVTVAVLLLPDYILNVIFTFSPSVISAEDLFNLWRKCLELMSHHLAVGIGIGAESFMEEMTALGLHGHPDSSNLFIELGLEAGIMTPLCFVILIIIRLRHRSMQYLYVRNSQIEIISNLSGACLFGLLAFGMVNYIWSDVSAYYLFWCIFGIGSASLRVAKRDYDDRVIYYEETSALDSSVIDIEIG